MWISMVVHLTWVVTYKIVKLNSGHTTVDTRDDLLGNSNRVNMVGVQAVTQSGHTGSDLVELDALLATIWKSISYEVTHCSLEWTTGRCIPRFLTNMVMRRPQKVAGDDEVAKGYKLKARLFDCCKCLPEH